MIEIAPDRDPLVRWALRAPGARVWRRTDAVVVACADLSHWDRLVINGEPEAVAGLLRQVLGETGETFRPFGTEELVTDIVAWIPELEVSATFAWMETTRPVQRGGMDVNRSGGVTRGGHLDVDPGGSGGIGLGRCAGVGLGGRGVPTGRDLMPGGPGPATVGGVPPGRRREMASGEFSGPFWLGEETWPEVTGMIREAYPECYAWPGHPGVHRWAGIRGADGELLAVAAEAWSTPEIGFMSGVTTRPSARGRGLGAAVCAFVTDELLAGRERVALLVDYWNTAALATYSGLGFTTRRVAAARRR
ncbi:GNAT family N-acetyltransferase [Actinoplanes xinjiangensis]|uniref:GNAT family N-acetyltransferase n=1 Tax=Actinoplanes xinjiangensis TaxID=512350 RepID=UPI00341BDEB8